MRTNLFTRKEGKKRLETSMRHRMKVLSRLNMKMEAVVWTQKRKKST